MVAQPTVMVISLPVIIIAAWHVAGQRLIFVGAAGLS
jgi:hypothetical protein